MLERGPLARNRWWRKEGLGETGAKLRHGGKEPARKRYRINAFLSCPVGGPSAAGALSSRRLEFIPPRCCFAVFTDCLCEILLTSIFLLRPE